jgi:hypothetical protein
MNELLHIDIPVLNLKFSALLCVFLHLYINLCSICFLHIRNFYRFFPLMSHNLPPLILLFKSYSYNWFIRVSLPIHLPTYVFIKFTSYALTGFDGIAFISLSDLFLLSVPYQIYFFCSLALLFRPEGIPTLA